MNTKTKVLTLLLAGLVLGATAFVVSAVPDENAIAPEAGIKAQTARRLIAQKHWLLGRWLLSKGVPETLEGTVVAHTAGITVLSVEGKNINVLTPAKWLVDGEIVFAKDLIPELSGQVTMQTLKVEYLGNVKTTIYAVYKITAVDLSAEAILPVNIQL